jgi:hypothetical protein
MVSSSEVELQTELTPQKPAQDMAGRESASSRPFVVVLTGGPCAGKTSAMAFLRDRLSKRGFQVLTVPENATHFLANSEGFQPEWAGKPAQVAMQRIFLEYQMAQEEAFKAFAHLHPTKRSILLLDCCTLNSKVYLTDEQWKQVLQLPGHTRLTEQQLFARYDLVIHMVSCAFEGLYEWGPGSNNPGRYHSPEEAKECDKRSLDVFANHTQVRVVPHFPNFHSKMQQVLHFLNDALHIDGLTGKRCRRQVRVKDVAGLVEVAAQATTTSFLVTSTFLDDQMESSLRRRATVPNQIWLDNFRKLTSTAPLCRTESYDDIEAIRDEHDVIYEQRSQIHVRDFAGRGDEGYLTRRLIKADDYYAAESVACSKRSTVKFVLSFVIDHRYYELFFFPSYKDPVLDLSDDVVRLPAWLEKMEGGNVMDIDKGVENDESASQALTKCADAETKADAPVAVALEAVATPSRGATSEQPRAKRQRVLVRYSTQEAACEP